MQAAVQLLMPGCGRKERNDEQIMGRALQRCTLGQVHWYMSAVS